MSLFCFAFAGFANRQAVADSSPGASTKVVDPRCEYLRNPLGIDVMQPRLSWKLAPTDVGDRGQRQTAYHVLVAGERDLLDRDRGDLWDSGLVKSDQSIHITYKGKALQSGMQCYWKVRVRDEEGILTNWSESARWTMGLLNESNWSAKWIGTDRVFERKPGWPPPDNTLPDPWFRKVFTLPERPKRATIYIASVGYHELYVNGKKVGDAVLVPSVANHRKRARYVTYEITDCLQPGKNVIGLWLGVSWSIFPHYKIEDRPQAPLVIAQAQIELPGGKHIKIVTDETWQTHPSPNTLLGVWDFMHYGGELYDAQKELPGWCEVQLDDANWQQACVYSPELEMSAEMLEPNRCIKEVCPVKMSEVSPDVYRVDMGVNMTGWLEAELAGEPGDEVEFKFSERYDQAMTHRLHSKYIIGPKGKGTFRNRFNYFTGRWIQIEGLSYRPSLDDVRGYLVRTDYNRAAHFECSNELLNEIYDATLWTFENLSLGGYVVDCPHRERMGYGGDAHATTEAAMNNYALGAFYTKWSQDWRDVQTEDGNLPYTAPTYWGGGGPAWSGYCVTLPWLMYERYGDIRILEQNFPTIQRWLVFLETKSFNNMLVRWGGKWDFLGDWLWPGAQGVNGDTRETLFFNNCYWIYNLQTAGRIAEILGKDDVAAAYRSRAEQIRKTVHEEFFNPEDHSYVNGFQGYLAIALLVGLMPEDLRPEVCKRLEHEILVRRNGHIHAGITAGYFVTEALLANNRHDLMSAMANKDVYPGWGDMLNRGATTLWESWDARNSLCHSSYLYIGTWFIEGLAGIKVDPQHPGFKQFMIRPGIVNDPSLKWVKADYESPYGRIVSNWQLQRGKFHLEVRIPPNTTATVYLPTEDERSVTEGGQPLRAMASLKSVRKQAGQVLLELDPGHYGFACPYEPAGSP
jgi:alpha-L-rhamnosidase